MVAVALWKLVLGTDGPTRLEKVNSNSFSADTSHAV